MTHEIKHLESRDHCGDTVPLLIRNAARVASTADCHFSCSTQSMVTIALVVFVGDAARGVLFPSLWPRIQSFGGKKVHQGIAVASFSLGRIVSSPLLGRYSELYGYRQVLLGSTAIYMLGCFAYLFANSLSTIFLAQSIIGTNLLWSSHYSRQLIVMSCLTLVLYAVIEHASLLQGLELVPWESLDRT